MSDFVFSTEKTISSDGGNSLKYQPKLDSKLAERRIKFCFSLISLDGKCLCYNCPQISLNDYNDFFEFLKYASGLTVTELLEQQEELHFHEIDLSKKYELKSILQSLLNLKPTQVQFPTIYQCAVKTNAHSKSPRIVFYIEAENLKLLFLDSNHSIYSTESGKCFNQYI
jgi:hypothetical protein